MKSKTLIFALRMLRRDARAGELRLLAGALVIAVAALTAVGFFTDRVRQALASEANQLLGADLLLISDHPWPAGIAASARASGLVIAETRTFASMAMAGEGDRAQAALSDVKAVSAAYPLRGSLRVAPALNVADAPAGRVPSAGEVWIDERLAATLAASVGERLTLGDQRFLIGAILTLEPDRGINFFSVAPRLLMNLADVEATGLLRPGSRVTYRLLVAGEPERVADFRKRIEKSLGRGERIEDAQNARPEIRAALERAEKFLGLSALLTIVLAAVAVALASRRFMQRHLDACAVMRCLGARHNFLLAAYLTQFAVLGLAASLVGCGLGYLAHFALHAWLAQLVASPLPPPSLLPALQGSLVGLLLLVGFSLPPILELKNVSTLRVLRREFFVTAALPRWWSLVLAYAIGLVFLAGLMFWMAGEVRLGAYIAGGFSAAMVVFAAVARLCVHLAARLRNVSAAGKGASASGVSWRYGLAALERHAFASVVQIVALALGFMALILLTVIRGDLLGAWQKAIPPQAANRFVINIQPGQLPRLREAFAGERVEAGFSPMIRGRLESVNGRATVPADYEDERARRLVDREFNLSYRNDLPPGNTVVAGRWFAGSSPVPAEASVEEGLARTLGLKLGDELVFGIAGERVAMKISSLRKLNWDSMRVNFFVLTPPAVLEAYSGSWITSFYLAPEKADFVNELVREFPNLTVIDVAAIVRQLQAIIDQVAQAVQFVFLFTLLAGIVVLYAALGSAADERRYELSIMRALGARRAQLRSALFAEMAVIGGLAGLIAALGALGVGQLLAHKAFQFEVAIDYSLIPSAMLGGALIVTAAGWFAAARLINSPPLEAIRAGV